MLLFLRGGRDSRWRPRRNDSVVFRCGGSTSLALKLSYTGRALRPSFATREHELSKNAACASPPHETPCTTQENRGSQLEPNEFFGVDKRSCYLDIGLAYSSERPNAELARLVFTVPLFGWITLDDADRHGLEGYGAALCVANHIFQSSIFNFINFINGQEGLRFFLRVQRRVVYVWAKFEKNSFFKGGIKNWKLNRILE